MKTKNDLIGKTITGIVAATPPGEDVREIWMLQFSDGSYVEFVSPQARRRMRRLSQPKKRHIPTAANTLQLALDVA
jgi:hypothetical protein